MSTQPPTPPSFFARHAKLITGGVAVPILVALIPIILGNFAGRGGSGNPTTIGAAGNSPTSPPPTSEPPHHEPPHQPSQIFPHHGKGRQ
ncbi:hypothetical protein BX265_5121 [Streptomyces sp. TLI_235]|nr:hypothetical protein BX265_5121 [Streptomyces sp. TLI_235]